MTRLRRPAPTVRLRLTAIYGGLFLASGATLLAITYFLLRREYTGKFFVNSGKLTDFAVPGFLPKGEGPRAHLEAMTPAAAAAGHAQSVAALHQLLVDSGIALAVMTVLSIWLGWLIAGRTLRPLRTITNTARDISATSLHRRLALAGPDDELTQLGTTFDGLLERLEAAFESQRRFAANASHELRTPLTFQRTLLELALGDPDVDAETRETYQELLAVGEEQEQLIDALLTLSQSQRGLDVHEPVDLAAITAIVTASSEPDGLVFETDLEPARTTGDPRLIERLVANLVTNAICHNHPDGHVAIETRPQAGHAILRVRNSGEQILAEDVARIFQPFERLEPDRHGSEGFGLGLSIVDAIANAHDAILTATPGLEGGLDIEVAFPVRHRASISRSNAAAVTAR